MPSLKKGTTDVVRYFMMRKVADGTAFTGATIATFDLQYTRELTAAATKIDAIVGTGGATTHVDNKVFEVDATSSPGLYMVCFPDAAFASGVDQVTLNLKYDATVFTEAQNIQLVAFDPFDAVRMGLTSLPNAVDIAKGGLTTLARNIVDIIESGRSHHTHISPGEIFYVDPVNGDTHANGNRGSINDPYLTIQDCHDNAVVDSRHDLILLVPGATAGITTHTVAATTTLSKRYLLIRGPGRDFIITRTGSGDTFAITGEGIELEGFQIGTAATGSGNGVSVTADFALLHKLWINDTQGDGININQSENCVIENNRFQNTGAGGSGDGLEINGTGSSSSNNIIRHNIFEDVAGDAIKLTGGTIDDTIIKDNTIHGSSGWGINIATGSNTFVIDNDLGNNTSGDITDSGTGTIDINNSPWAKHSIATEARLAELDAGNLPADIAAIPTAAEVVNEWETQSQADPTGFHVNLKEIDGNASLVARFKEFLDANVLFSDTAQAGGASTITLAAGTSLADNDLVDYAIYLNGGLGAGQFARIESVVASSQVAAIVTPNNGWATVPDVTTTYVILSAGSIVHISSLHAAALTEITNELDANSTLADWVDGGRLDLILDEILADQDSMGITKNATFSNFEFPMVLTSDHYTAATSKTVTGERSIDGAAFTGVAGAIAEVGSGVYQIDFLAADTNGDVITYKFSATDCDDTIITVTTRL